MSGILRLESLTKGNTLKQGDKTPLKYRLFDADGEKLNIAGKSAVARLMYPDFLRAGYESETLTVSSDNTVTFSIDKIIHPVLYYLEITVDGKYIFPSRNDESKLNIDKSSQGSDATIIEIIGKDVLVRDIKNMVDSEIKPVVDDMIVSNQKVLENEQVVQEVNILSKQLETRQDQVEQFNNQVITEMTNKDVISAPEILGARGSFDTLGERLNDTTAQLAQTADGLNSQFINVLYPPHPLTAVKGDGITDDHPAIQAIIDLLISQGGGKVFFPAPPVNYLITKQLEVDANIELTGVFGKSILKLADNSSWQSVIETKGVWNAVDQKHNNIKINNLVIDGNKENQPSAPSGTGGVQHGIYLHGCDNAIIENLIIFNCQGDGICPTAHECVNITIRNNHIYDNLRAGISLVYGSNINIYDNILINNHLDLEAEMKCENIRAWGNYIEHENAPVQISSVATEILLSKVTFENNTIFARGRSDGSNSLSTVLNTYNCKDVIVRNNHVIGRNVDDSVLTSIDNVLRTSNCINLLIESNIFRDIKGRVVITNGGINKITIKNNTFDNVGATSVIVDVLAPNTVIQDNNISGNYYDATGKFMGMGDIAVAIRASALGCKFNGNNIKNSRYHFYNYAGANNILRDNVSDITMGGGNYTNCSVIPVFKENYKYNGTSYTLAS